MIIYLTGIADGVAALNTRGFMERAHSGWEGGPAFSWSSPGRSWSHGGLGGGARGPLANGGHRGQQPSLLTCKALQGKHLLSLNVNFTVNFFFFNVKKGRKNMGRKEGFRMLTVVWPLGDV